MSSIVPEGTDMQDRESLTVSVEIYPPDGAERALRQIGYGVTPFALIEPGYDEETDETSWNFVGSLVDDPSELAELLEAALEVLRGAIQQAADNAALRQRADQ